jgi:hypothetical protein
MLLILLLASFAVKKPQKIVASKKEVSRVATT